MGYRTAALNADCTGYLRVNLLCQLFLTIKLALFARCFLQLHEFLHLG